MAYLFKKGYENKTIDSPIQAYHFAIDGVAVGKQPQGYVLMYGVFNTKFPRPKYGFTWAVQVIFDCVNLNLIFLKELTMKGISYKLVISLALKSSERVSTFKT